MSVSAIIAAGGRGVRFGGFKQLTEIGGVSLLERSVGAFVDHPAIDEIIVALPAEIACDLPDGLRSVAKALRVVPGGERRQDSVANAFNATSPSTDIIVIHDAARPFVTADLITRTIAAAEQDGAALAALQARDTVKRTSVHVVTETIQRESIYLAQTPQAFRRSVLEAALKAAARGSIDATDEAVLAERAGFPVRVVDGSATNIKITTIEDLAIGEAFVRQSRPARTGRAGIGYDLHRLVKDRPLILGGITIPFEYGLAGHSDADAVCHAVTDAILGAAGAGDIGRHFPDTDPAWHNASSLDLLRRAVSVIRGLGFEVGNIDVTVIAERPKLAPYIDKMRAALSHVLGVSIDRVSIKGKTNEGVGELGRGEAVAVHAIALVRQL